MDFPIKGRDKTALLEDLKSFKNSDLAWKKGRAFSYIYYADPQITALLSKAYEIYFSENALNPTAFPSLRKMEIETVAMCKSLFNASPDAAGVMTSGGTESILMAVKAAKNFAQKKGITKGQMIMPITAHPAFNKACDYFDVEPVIVPVGNDFRAIPSVIEQHITKQTILIVNSAPSYPQGVVDPIEETGKIAIKHQIPFHVDACVGGFVLPFVKNPRFSPWDLSVPGVTSISADIHKYGFASKGSSVIIYNDPELRKAQFYVYTDWPGGIYASPSILGTRPGGAIAVAWTVLNMLGREGYEQQVELMLETAHAFQKFLTSFDGIKVFGNPDMCIFSIGSDLFDIYELGDEMHALGWMMDRQQNPSAIHLSISPIHAQIFEEFKSDFEKAYKRARRTDLNTLRKNIQVKGAKVLEKVLPEKAFNKIKKAAIKGSGESVRSAALYGMMGDLRGSGTLDEMIVDFLDNLLS